MHPEPPTREEGLADYTEMWQDEMRRLEAHGDEHKLALVYKINALRMLMAGAANEYFDLLGADRGNTDAARSCEGLLTSSRIRPARGNLTRRFTRTCSTGAIP